MRAIDSLQTAALAAHLADEKKATDVVVLDVRDTIKISDYFVVVTGHSRPQVRAIHDAIHVRLKQEGVHYGRAEGAELGWWVLLDYGDVVVHILQPDAREYYDLESLYADAPRVDWRAVELPRAATGESAG